MQPSFVRLCVPLFVLPLVTTLDGAFVRTVLQRLIGGQSQSASANDELCRFALFEPHTSSVAFNSSDTFTVRLNIPSEKRYVVHLVVEHSNAVVLAKNVVYIPPRDTDGVRVTYRTAALKSSVYVAENKTDWRQECVEEAIQASSFLLVTVYRLGALNILSDVLGWLYFTAWTVSFWPQIFLNFRRKSVVGLHFDFLALNATGFLFYSVYNCAMYFSRQIQHEYQKFVPNSVNPVQVQDVAFALHALIACLITIVQCFFCERGSQRVSRLCTVLLVIFWGVAVSALIAAGLRFIPWLFYITLLSYTKLIISIVKYIPQVVLNYKRKSTDGFSIGAVFLDFIGSMGSMFQMIFIAYNMDEWTQFFGDFTKFGLGLQSLVFDIIFFVQRFVLYRRYNNMEESISSGETELNK